MSLDPNSTPETAEQSRRRLERMGFRPEQVQEMQRLAASMAQQQMRRSIETASNFITTVVALLSSAVGFVAALAWNNAISAWLPTINLFNTSSDVLKKFYYAIVATVFAIVVIAVLGFINGRIKGQNLINNTNQGM
jgi:VIT1/CCC1 family predicted Fe2+/Mn2+ transporter